MLTPNSGTGDVEKGSYTLTIVKQTLTVELEDKEIFYGASFDYGEVSGMPEGKLVYTEKFLTVLPKEITVEIDDAEVVYGEDATLKYTAEGLFVNDKLYLYSDYSAGKDVGEYAIRIRPDANYDIKANSAFVCVSQKPLNVFISDVTSFPT